MAKNHQSKQHLAFRFHQEAKIEQAKIIYEQILSSSPDDACACLNLGNILLQLGDKAKAFELLYKAKNFEEYQALACFSLVNAGAHQSDKQLISELILLYQKNNFADLRDQASVIFALAKIYDEAGDYDQAFSYYQEANSLASEELKYDINLDKTIFERIKQTVNREFIASNLTQELEADAPDLIFVLGMPRSGTSLVEQILASGVGVYGAGELKILAAILHQTLSVTRPVFTELAASLDQAAWLELGGQYQKNLEDFIQANTQTCSFVVDKTPSNFMYLALIKLMLPRAKIVHCKRDPIDTCWSNFKQYYFGGQHFSFDLENLRDYYLLYQDLMQHWLAVLPEGSFYTIEYEKLVQDLEPQSRALFDYCGLEWTKDCLDFDQNPRAVRTASMEQVRSKLYTSSLGSWRNYKKYLDVLQSL